jgi:GTPase
MLDVVELEVIAGSGGPGVVSFRREKFVPRGGPDGGDGGRGGDVVLFADRRLSTLDLYADGRPRQAEHGHPGGPNRRRGASAAALELRVPVGSVVWDLEGEDETPLADLAEDGTRVIVARGGRGGWGNKRFATPVRQAPKFAQDGAAGQHRRLRIELKLLADVGLIGLPNAGKSTLLATWSRARPKIASYPFTTLEPELGVVSLGYDSFVAADMPGLIEGASAGVGLGHEFLRHIERTRVLVHLLDMTRDDPLADRDLINAELSEFGHGLAEKPQLLALNKVDHPDGRAQVELLEEQLQALDEQWFVISGATGEGTRELAQRALQLVRELQEAEQHRQAREVPVLRPEPQRRRRFEAYVAEDGVAVIDGPTPNWLAATLDLEERDPREEFFGRLRRLGVHREMQRLGVMPGDTVRVGDVEVVWEV